MFENNECAWNFPTSKLHMLHSARTILTFLSLLI